jgi:hypothetical protein
MKEGSYDMIILLDFGLIILLAFEDEELGSSAAIPGAWKR